MYKEQCIVTLSCDRKGCCRLIQLHADDHDGCQILLFYAGWRVSHGKQICPTHVKLHNRNRRRKGDPLNAK